MSRTRIEVSVRDGRHLVRTAAGALRAQRLHGPQDRARVALIAQTALLLGGDEVEVDVVVGPGARLELSDIAGTVAYHGRGSRSSWHTRIRVEQGARCSYAGAPLVIGDGAHVLRSLTVDLAGEAVARLRETVVFGRSGELGGALDAQTTLRRDGVEFCRERLLSDAVARARPGVLSGIRVVDSVLALGDAPPAVSQPDVSCFQLLEHDCTLTRYLAAELAGSPLRSTPVD